MFDKFITIFALHFTYLLFVINSIYSSLTAVYGHSTQAFSFTVTFMSHVVYKFYCTHNMYFIRFALFISKF